MARLPLARVIPRPGPRGRLLPTVLGLALAAGLADHALAQAPSFTLIQPPAGNRSVCEVTGISADGQVASGAFDVSAFVWRRGSGYTDLAGGTGVPDFSRAYGISGDGTTIVGEGHMSGQPSTAFRYQGPGSYQSLGNPPGFSSSRANGISGDGSVIVGAAFAFSGQMQRAFRWTPGGGSQALPGGDTTWAAAVSRDAGTIVGNNLGIGCMWPAGGGIVQLPLLPDGSYARATAVNFDGSVIVGGRPVGGPVMWRGGQGRVASKCAVDVPLMFWRPCERTSVSWGG